jgi:hypothetical protein
MIFLIHFQPTFLTGSHCCLSVCVYLYMYPFSEFFRPLKWITFLFASSPTPYFELGCPLVSYQKKVCLFFPELLVLMCVRVPTANLLLLLSLSAVGARQRTCVTTQPPVG